MSRLHPALPFPYLLAAIDVDDTLLGPDKTVSQANRTAIDLLRYLGCRVVLASGRRHDNMLSIVNDLGLDDFAISCQGARAEHVRSGEIVHEANIGRKQSTWLIAEGIARSHSVVVWRRDGIFCACQAPEVVAYLSETGQEPIGFKTVAELTELDAEKIVWLGEPQTLENSGRFFAQSHSEELAMTAAHNWVLEFSHPEASKAAAVQAVARSAGIPQKAVLAFGDGYNDVSMLQWAGLGVAMAHGRSAAHVAANRISPAGDPQTALARAVTEVVGQFCPNN